MLDRKITNECVAFGFYSITADPRRLELFYNDLKVWFDAVQCPPDKIAVQAPGFGDKPITFSRGDTRLHTRKFADVKCLEVTAMLSTGAYFALDWWATASVDLGLALRPYFALAARSSVTTLDDEAVTHLIASCISNLKPAYGIGFHRNHDQGPWFYAAGMHYGSPVSEDYDAAYDEALTISRWGDLAVVKEVYMQGILRDVYPHNYLSEPQLKKRIGKQTLREWILSESSRGTLTPINDHMMLWKVLARQIPPIRKQLSAAGLIFDWRNYLDE